MFNAALLGFMMVVSCSDPEKETPTEKPPVHAHTEVIQLSTISGSFQALGTVRARTSTVLSSRAVGQIVSLTVREGDYVRQGQVVAEIENREAGAQLRRARAAVVEAQRGLEEAEGGIRGAEAAVRAAETNRDLALATRNRYDFLRERRSLSPQEYDEVDARYKAAAQDTERAREALASAKARRLQVLARIEQAEAETEAAGAALEYSRIVSPIDGIATGRTAEPGMLATPGLPLLAVEDPRTYELEVAVEESRAAAVRLGQSVRIEIDALGGAAMDARVREIAPSSDPATRTYAVTLQLPGSRGDRTLRSGLFGRAFFPAGSLQVLLVPQSALIRRGQLEGLYIVADDIAVFRLVKTGKPYEQGVEILSGLAPGTRIVRVPPPEISDGVQILEDEGSGSTP
jgi:multidrug efflux system membrane fusion protein